MTDGQLDRAIGSAFLIASFFKPDIFPQYVMVVAAMVFYISGMVRK
jgi:hypothetical protein